MRNPSFTEILIILLHLSWVRAILVCVFAVCMIPVFGLVRKQLKKSRLSEKQSGKDSKEEMSTGPSKQLFKPSIFIILNLILLLTLVLPLLILTSSLPYVPWHDPFGTAIMAIPVVVLPLLFVIGIMLFILSGSYQISRFNKWLPFIAIAGIVFPILLIATIPSALDSMFHIKQQIMDLFMGIGLGIAGCINIVLCLLTITTTVRHFRVVKKFK